MFSRESIYAVILILVAALFGYGFASCQHEQETKTLINRLSNQSSEVTLVLNKNQSLLKALKKIEEENQELLDQISELKGRGEQIRYIYRDKIVLAGDMQKYELLPESYVHLLNEEIPIAYFEQEEDAFRFETYDLNLETSIVIGSKSTAASLIATSSADPTKTYELPTEVTVTRIKDSKLFEPQLALGFSFTWPNPTPQPTVTVPMFHVADHVDIASPRLSVGPESLSVGLDLVGINLGPSLPVVTDLWLSPTIGYNSKSQIEFGLTFSTKL